MKKILAITLLFVIVITSFAQNYRILEQNPNKIILKIKTGNITTTDATLNGQNYTRLKMDGFFNDNHVGNPGLPVMTELLEIPICDDVYVTATAGSVTTYDARELGIKYPLYPSQPSERKTPTTPHAPIINTETYLTNDFYGNDLASIEKNGIMRNINLATLYVSPVKYNPVTEQIMIYEDITVEITYERPNFEATKQMKKLHGNSQFNIASKVINPMTYALRDEISTVPIKYEIVAHSMFRGELDEFINWKRRKGFLVEVAYTDSIGETEDDIKSYLKGLYTNATETNPAPTYVLLVGDVEQIPSNSIYQVIWIWEMLQHVTDLYYFTWTDGDILPDCYYGRFSAQDVSQLTPQIEKSLMYEQYTMRSPSYLDHAVVVAGQDDGSAGDYGYSHANPVMHYLEDTYLTSDYGYTQVDAFYNPHASTAAEEIQNLLYRGVGYANYSAHCSSEGWSIPKFEKAQVSSMNNRDKYGLMIGNCCQSNKFEESECFGEKLLRIENKGAVGYIGGSDYTYWDEDYYWAVGARPNMNSGCSNCNEVIYDANNMGAYDQLFHTHGEGYTHWFVTQGSMIVAGNLGVQASTTDAANKEYYWEIYHLMGDPSIMPWLTQAKDMNISINNAPVLNNTCNLPAGTTTLSVYTGAPYAYIALTSNLELITAAQGDANGYATLTFPELATGTNYELAATAQNYKPNFTTLLINEVGIENYTSSDIAIFPNPTTQNLTIKLNHIDATDIQLFDVTGKLLYNINSIGQTINVDTENLPAGLYFVKVLNHNELLGTYKVVKK